VLSGVVQVPSSGSLFIGLNHNLKCKCSSTVVELEKFIHFFLSFLKPKNKKIKINKNKKQNKTYGNSAWYYKCRKNDTHEILSIQMSLKGFYFEFV